MNDLSKEKVMTVKEVSEILGVTPEAIRKHTRMLFPEKLKQGEKTYLTETETVEIKKKMRQSTKVVGAVTDLEKAETIQKAMLYISEEIKILKDQLEIQKPAVEFYNAVAGSADAIEMREVAAVLNREGWGRNKVFSFLRKSKVLDGDNLPYRRYQDEGYFRVVEQKFTDSTGETRISLKTLVYQKGVEWIGRLLDRYIEKDIY